MCCVRPFGQIFFSIVQKYEYDVKVSRTRTLYEDNVVQMYDRKDAPLIENFFDMVQIKIIVSMIRD